MFISIRPNDCIVQHSNHYPDFGNTVTSEGKTIFVKGAPRLYQEPDPHNVVTREKVIKHSDNIKSAALIQKLLRHVDFDSWGNYLTGNFLLVVVNEALSKCYIIQRSW